jgi:hypothetical protein
MQPIYRAWGAAERMIVAAAMCQPVGAAVIRLSVLGVVI